MTFPCGPFDCECEARVKCPAGKKVSACYCYNSNPRTKTDDKREYADSQKYPNRGHPAHKGSFPWMLASVAGFDGVPGEISDDGTCSCSWINTILLVGGLCGRQTDWVKPWVKPCCCHNRLLQRTVAAGTDSLNTPNKRRHVAPARVTDQPPPSPTTQITCSNPLSVPLLSRPSPAP